MLKWLLIRVIRVLLRALWIFPVKKNRIVLTAFNAKQYGCNPKYISEYLQTNYPEKFEIIWAFASPNDFLYLKEKKIKLVKFNSPLFFYCFATARIMITNTGLPSHLIVRKRQTLLNTWHGSGAYKKCGVDAKDADTFTVKKIALAGKDTTYLISGCKRFSEVMSHSILMPKEMFLEIGLPRNDILLRPHAEQIRRVRDFYQIPAETRLLLFAPTFRGSTKHAEKEEQSLAIQACLSALSHRFGGSWRALYRAHYFTSTSVPTTDTVINVSGYPDMQELLCAADVLITDYSSCMWDMSLTGKPCFLYAPDVEAYQRQRDFYTPISEWPFPLAKSNSELAEQIAAFDEAQYAAAIREHHADFGSFETGHATEDIAKMIDKICFQDH